MPRRRTAEALLAAVAVVAAAAAPADALRTVPVRADRAEARAGTALAEVEAEAGAAPNRFFILPMRTDNKMDPFNRTPGVRFPGLPGSPMGNSPFISQVAVAVMPAEAGGGAQAAGGGEAGGEENADDAAGPTTADPGT